MSRFANRQSAGRKKIDNDGLCRCCGLEQDENYSILGENPFNFDGTPFHEKYSKLLGIEVNYDDNMPQNICLMCSDKINDFHEFRLMAESTENQTRETLGLPQLNLQQSQVQIQQMENEMAQLKKNCINYENKISFLQRRLTDIQKKSLTKVETITTKLENSIPKNSRKRGFKQEEISIPDPISKKIKKEKEFTCNICTDRHFSLIADLKEHQSSAHVVNFAKHGCAACHETFEMMSELKAHKTMHNRTKKVNICWICDCQILKYNDFSVHIKKCWEANKPERTVEDIKCFQCRKKFLTQNLFEWHGCFIKSKGNCNKCQKYYAKKNLLFKHYLECEGLFIIPETALDPIKKEKFDAEIETISRSRKNNKKKNKEISSTEIEDNFNYEAENMEFEPDLDDFQNNDDSDEEIPLNPLEPSVKLEMIKEPAINIKQEKSNQLTIQERISEMIRSIKQEKSTENENVIQQDELNHDVHVNIKPEKNSNEAVSIKFLNPLAVKNNKSSKKIYQMNPALLAKIKKEKIDANERDEAEPEDEDLFGTPSILQIKQEKLDERDEAEPEDEDLLHGSMGNFDEPQSQPVNDVVKIKKEKQDIENVVTTMTKKPRQLINPIALEIAKRKLQQELEGNLENSLQISSVTSINQKYDLNSNNNATTSDTTQENIQNIYHNRIEMNGNEDANKNDEKINEKSSLSNSEVTANVEDSLYHDFDDLLNSNQIS